MFSRSVSPQLETGKDFFLKNTTDPNEFGILKQDVFDGQSLDGAHKQKHFAGPITMQPRSIKNMSVHNAIGQVATGLRHLPEVASAVSQGCGVGLSNCNDYHIRRGSYRGGGIAAAIGCVNTTPAAAVGACASPAIGLAVLAAGTVVGGLLGCLIGSEPND